MLVFRILGPLEVRDTDDRPVRVVRRMQRALLALLLVRAGTVVRHDEILAALWGGQPPASARANTHMYISGLRRTLAGVSNGAGTARLRSLRIGYQLDLAPGECDAVVFEALVAEGRRLLADGEAALGAERLARALGLWRGEVLEGLDSYEWLGPVKSRLEQARLAAIEDHVEARLRLGRQDDIVAELTAATRMHPFRERLWIQLMTALHREGRRAEALSTYDRMRALLDHELGIEPGGAAQALRRQMQRGGRATGFVGTCQAG